MDQDKVKTRDFVNTVMKLSGYMKAGYFLTR
jgi:hypothetical protein